MKSKNTLEHLWKKDVKRWVIKILNSADVISFIRADIEKEIYRPENVDIFLDDVLPLGVFMKYRLNGICEITYPTCYRVSRVSCLTSFFPYMRCSLRAFMPLVHRDLLAFVCHMSCTLPALVHKIPCYLRTFVASRLCVLCASCLFQSELRLTIFTKGMLLQWFLVSII